MKTTLTSAPENGRHGNIGCLATQPQNLHFMSEYFKNENVYELQNKHLSLAWGSGQISLF